jgi:hypothetical protein
MLKVARTLINFVEFIFRGLLFLSLHYSFGYPFLIQQLRLQKGHIKIYPRMGAASIEIAPDIR